MTNKPFRLTLAQLVCNLLPPVGAYKLRNLIYPVKMAENHHQRYPITTLTGATVNCPVDDYAGYLFCTQGYGEWRHWVIAMALCQTGDTLIEVGAQFGLETSGFARITAERNGQVYTFEPLPVNLDRLQTILSENNLNNVVVNPAALGERVETVQFVVPPVSHTGIGRVHTGTETTDQLIDIDTVTLDSLTGQFERVPLIVMDVEGHEIPVLRGGKSFIATYKPAIIVEATEEGQEQGGYSLRALQSEMEEMGYTVYRINRFGLDLAEPDNPRKRNWNWIGIHNSEPDSTRRKIIQAIRRCGMLPPIAGINPLVMR